MIRYTLVPYSLLLEEGDDDFHEFQKSLLEAVSRFTCVRSNSVNSFIHTKVQGIEESHEGSTYLFVTVTDEGRMEVVAFFELCLTSIDFSKLTKNMRNRMSGPYSHFRNDHAGSYCIGELGRSDLFDKTQMPGKRILQEAINIIVSCRDIVGGRYTLIDARQEIFDELYKGEGFKLVDHIKVEEEGDCDIAVGIAKTTKWVKGKLLSESKEDKPKA